MIHSGGVHPGGLVRHIIEQRRNTANMLLLHQHRSSIFLRNHAFFPDF
jgi:hypothetical protein